MSKDTSSKKVARAARAGGGRARAAGERNLLFPVAMVLVVILGIALIVYARQERIDDVPTLTPAEIPVQDDTGADDAGADDAGAGAGAGADADADTVDDAPETDDADSAGTDDGDAEPDAEVDTGADETP